MSDDPHHDPSFATAYSQFSSLFDNFADQKQVHSHHDNSPGSPSQSQSTAVPGSRRTYSPFSDDDRSTARPSSPRSLHRRASHVQQWLEQQPNVSPNPSHDVRTTPRAKDRGNYSYAYRTPSGAHDPTCDSSDQTDDGTLGSFVLVPGDEADIPPREFLEDENGQSRHAGPSHMRPPGSRLYSGFFNPPTAFRNIHLPLSSNSRRPSPAPRSPPSPSLRQSMFSRPHTSTGNHYRTSSTSTMAPNDMTSTTDDPASHHQTLRSTRNWTLKRPRILGGFLSAPNPSSSASPTHLQPPRDMAPPRPSFSSTNTVSSGAASTHVSGLPADSGSTNGGTPSRIKPPSPSLWSLPSNASHLHDLPGSEAPLASRKPRKHFTQKLQANSPSPIGRVPSMLSMHKDWRKKKLVISGVAKGDERRLANVRRWCESFGEVNQISRAPNGDLHVDFRRTEVADTVCRVNARVQIAGVGSVSLSWYTGKKP